VTHDSKPLSINAQIRATERQLSNHQHAVDSHAKTLVGKLYVKPGTLLFAAGIGFVFGELTKCQSSGTGDTPQTDETSPLKVALDLLASARTLYAALPLVLMITSRYQTGTARGSDENKTTESRDPH
jgi:hypothetical protein